jgi:hypothetical protein
MPSLLILNTPWQGTGNREIWEFSGADDKALQDCLDQLDAFAVADPEDPWSAAIAYAFQGQSRYWLAKRPGRSTTIGASYGAHRGWSLDGAMALADLLSERLSDLRADLLARFSARVAEAAQHRES